MKITGRDFNQVNQEKAKIDSKVKLLTPQELVSAYKRAGWIAGPGGVWLPPLQAPFNLGGYDISKLELGGIPLKTDLMEALTAAKAIFTIEGASTITLGVEDPTRELIAAGMTKAGSKATLDLDGFLYRLVKITKQNNNFDLVFEDETINKLRRRGAKRGESKRWERGKYTRSQVIYELVKEVIAERLIAMPELSRKLPIKEPEAAEKPPIVRNAEKNLGFPPGVQFNVKGESKASAAQIKAAQEMLEQGVAMGIDKRGLVAGIMAAIQESDLNTEFDKNPASEGYGILSQTRQNGWPGTGNVKVDAKPFFERLKIQEESSTHFKTYGELINAVQASADASLYDPWKENADKIVELFTGSGTLPKTLSSKVTSKVARPYFFERKNEEDSWTFIQRLASEVQWRAFVIRGVFYYVSEEYLLKSGPIREISEFDQDSGVDWINYEKDVGQAFQTAKVLCRAGIWDVLPGSMIEVTDLGPSQGTWLVYTIELDLFRANVEVTINAAISELPEAAPAFENISRPRSRTAAGGGKYGALVGKGAAYAGPDQGIDFTGKAAIYALEECVVTRIGFNTGWEGEGNIIVYEITTGPNNGRFVYMAEDLHPVPGVSVGSKFNKGDQIAEATGSGRAPGIECGFAQNREGEAYGHTSDGKGGNPPNKEALAFLAYVEQQSKEKHE